MKIIEPIQPDETTLTSSSITASAVALWDAGTSYSIGNEVRRFFDGAYHIFEALIASTGEDPADQPVDSNGDPFWLDKGATNRWAMFDGSVGSPSEDTSDIVVEYTPGRKINSVALFNVVGSTVNVTATSATAGGEVYNETQDTTAARGGGWYNWYFSEFQVSTRFQFFGIPPYNDIVITVTVTLTSGNAEIGEMVFGNEFFIGEDQLGMEPRIKDYSTNEFNSTFGYNTLVRRKTRRRLRTEVVIRENRADTVFRKMESIASQRVVWISDKYETGNIYGFYSDFVPTHSTHPLVFATLKIEGLV